MAASDLVTGLPVSVETTQGPNELFASSVKFKAGDLKTAQQIHAGAAQARAELAAKDVELQAKDAQLRDREPGQRHPGLFHRRRGLR